VKLIRHRQRNSPSPATRRRQSRHAGRAGPLLGHDQEGHPVQASSRARVGPLSRAPGRADDPGGSVTTARPATRPRRRTSARARDLPHGEWERLLRERAYLRPLPAAVPLHVMGRRREVPGSQPARTLP
jgi:hypothetical protein